MRNDNPIYWKGLLLIAGSGQNTGKTTLACKIISHHSRHKKIVSLKASPHIHNDTGNANLISKGENWFLFRESNQFTNKDSSLMLKAGAEESYFLQYSGDGLTYGLSQFEKIITKNSMVICESAGIRRFIKPDLYLVTRQLSCRVQDLNSEKVYIDADRIITFTGNGFDFNIDELIIKNSKWLLQNLNY